MEWMRYHESRIKISPEKANEALGAALGELLSDKLEGASTVTGIFNKPDESQN